MSANVGLLKRFCASDAQDRPLLKAWTSLRRREVALAGINPPSQPGSITETSPDWWQNVRFLIWNRARLDGYLPAFANSPLGPEEIAVLAAAYERILRKLSLVDRNDPITELIAKKVIELGQRGVRDPGQLLVLTIKELGVE